MQDRSVSYRKRAEEWKTLSDESKYMYILQSINEAKAHHKPVDIAKKLSKEELRIYLRYDKRLVKPPHRHYYLYASETGLNVPVGELSYESYVRRKFASLNFKIQMVFLRKFIQVWTDFQYLSDKVSNKDPVDAAIVKRAFQGDESFKSTCRRQFLPSTKFTYCNMPNPEHTFNDMPLEPPITILAVYLFFKRKRAELCGAQLLQRMSEARAKISHLHPVIRKSMQDMAEDNQNHYAEDLLKYVSTMSDTRLRTFLGRRRVPLFRKLKKDIFEEKYPCRKYPVYKWNVAVPVSVGSKVINKPTKRSNNEMLNELTKKNKPVWNRAHMVKAIYQSMAQLDKWIPKGKLK